MPGFERVDDMQTELDIKNLLEELKKNKTVRTVIPMGFVAGLPIVQIKNKAVCLEIPYFKFVRSEVPDQSLIYPIRYTVSVLADNGRLIGFEDLFFDERFETTDFNKAIGRFRHEAIQKYNYGQYLEKKDTLYALYNRFISFLYVNTQFTRQDMQSLIRLINILIEPALVPAYKVLDSKFAGKFLR